MLGMNQRYFSYKKFSRNV